VETFSGVATPKRSTLPASQQLYRIWLNDLEWCHETTVQKDLPFDVANESFLREITRPFQKRTFPNENFPHYCSSTDQSILQQSQDRFEQNHPSQFEEPVAQEQ
jgi:hypothetical protein